MTRVVFVIVDALPLRHVNADVTPTLAALAREGSTSTGRAVMTSATYPNHATFATGVDPIEHGLLANWIVHEERPRPAYHVGPAVPTIFDACRAAGRSSAAVVGDQHLIGVMGAKAADSHWPPGGELPEGIARDAHGYAADHEVLPRLLDVLEGDRPDLVVGHLNEPDTYAHVHGPDSDAALDSYRRADAAIAAVVEALRPTWDQTALIVVSDHDQEDVWDELELHAIADAAGASVLCLPEGSAAIAWGDDESGGAWLDGVPGIAGHREVREGVRLVWSDPGHAFRPPAPFRQDPADRGMHGGVRTRAQVAISAGGAPLPVLPRQIDAAEWAGRVTDLLGISPTRRPSSPVRR